MQSFAKGLSRKLIRRQSGSVATLGALWLMVAVICLATIDIGNVFWQKRELQKIADLAALASVSGGLTTCSSNAKNIASNNGFKSDDSILVECGNWAPGVSAKNGFKKNIDPFNAGYVLVERNVPFFFVFGSSGGGRRVFAEAIGWRGLPAAALSIRNTILNLDTEKSILLNNVVGKLLGGNINLSVGGWKGLLDADINLLKFLDILAVKLGVNAGDYDQLLKTDVGVGILLQTAIDAVKQSGNTADVALKAVDGLAALMLGVSPFDINVGKLLNLQTGLPSSALNLGVKAFDLVQAFIQIGNSKNAIAIDVPVDLLGLAGVNVSARFIEPMQLSSIGDPNRVRINPLGPDKIYVRTAQVRVLVSIEGEKPLVQALRGTLKALTFITVDPVLSLVNLLFGGKPGFVYTEFLPKEFRLDISLDLGASSAYVTDYSCEEGGKILNTNARASVVDLRLGKMGNNFEEAKKNAFSSKNPVVVKGVPVVSLDCLGCEKIGAVSKQFYGGIGLGASAGLDKSNNLDFPNPPKIEDDAQWRNINFSDLIGSISGLVKNLNVVEYLTADPSADGRGVSKILEMLRDLVGIILEPVGNLFANLLSPILDPIINTLLKTLGIDLISTQVGGRLSCGNPELVY